MKTFYRADFFLPVIAVSPPFKVCASLCNLASTTLHIHGECKQLFVYLTCTLIEHCDQQTETHGMEIFHCYLIHKFIKAECKLDRN